MGLRKNRLAFERGEITKAWYGRMMQAEHERLGDYADYLKDTDIASITLGDEGVVMTTRAHGIRMTCDPSDMGVPPIAALNMGSYEKADGSLMLSLVDDGMNFFDVGANIGWYAVHVARLFPRSHVFAFEPVPRAFQFLVGNLELNEAANARAFPFGLFSEPGTRTFHVDPLMTGATSSAELASGSGSPQRCRVETLDRVVADLGVNVDFIKVDVEGAELFAIRGGLSCIGEMKPVIFVELLRKHAATFGYHPNQVIGLLAGLGYRCFTARGGSAVEFHCMDERTVETNFVFLHPARHAAKIERFLSVPAAIAA